jgi:sugar O-acyltransferase (sialic acid O-acetyltransferase NeuD family)
MRSIFIFGRGGHARVIASLLDHEAVFIDRDQEEDFFARIESYRKSEIYLGIGNDKTRRKLFDRLYSYGIAPARCVATTAYVANSAHIGIGSVICPGAVIMADAHIGANAIINTLSSVDHDSRVGNHTQITVGVTIPGDVKIGSECFFGVKSATFPRVSIGDRVVVRGGSLVVQDVPANVVVSGNPAIIIRRTRNPESISVETEGEGNVD